MIAPFRDRAWERRRMVKTWIEDGPADREPVRDRRVLRAMTAVPRHAFVPEDLQDAAYDDRPLPVGHGQTISQPWMVAKMTEILDLKPDSRVLEIGTGSGYQAAILYQLTPHVFTIEVVEPLAARAWALLDRLGYAGIRRRIGDGSRGWPEEAPFDRLILTCAAGRLPVPLWKQLKPGGRAVFPLGEPDSAQTLMLVEKSPDGSPRPTALMAVQFVPLT